MSQLTDIKYKEQILNNFFNKLQAEYNIHNLVLKINKTNQAVGSNYNFKNNIITIDELSKTSIESLLLVLAHEYKHAIQFQSEDLKKIQKKVLFKIIMVVTILFSFSIFFFFPELNITIFSPDVLNFILKILKMLPFFMCHFIFSSKYKQDRINLEIEADLFSHQKVGGGAEYFKKYTGISYTISEYLMNFLGIRMHPYSDSRYEIAKQYPLQTELIDELTRDVVKHP